MCRAVLLIVVLVYLCAGAQLHALAQSTALVIQYHFGDNRVTTDLLVGADGIHSVVRRVLFGKENNRA